MKTDHEQKFDVSGMSCTACSARVENAVKSVVGVKTVTVSLLTGEMLVSFCEPATISVIIEAVKKSGYNAVIAQNKKIAPRGKSNEETAFLLRRLIASSAILIALMYLSMGEMASLPFPKYLKSAEGAYIKAIAELILSLFVLVINRRFFSSGLRALVNLSPNMDTLVALGSGVSFIYSAVMTALIISRTISGDLAGVHQFAHELYFEGAAMIVTLITVGKTLESYSKSRTTDAISALMSLAPENATVLSDGKETTVPVGSVNVGDHIVIRSGESVPVDAQITEGSGWFDESSMTGESVPVEATAGREIFCGTVLTNGYVIARATKVGEDTSLNRIVGIVKNVNLTKAPIAKTADKVSGVFVPTVIALSLLTFLIWILVGEKFPFALQRCVAVTLISCPCALGLATPVAIMVGSGVGAKRGTLFKSATSLENLGKVGAVVFDKTGTITFGKPTVTDIIPAEGHTENELLTFAASLERLSEHPLARAIVERFDGEPLAVSDYAAVTGRGLCGVSGGETLVGGNEAMMNERGVDVSRYAALAGDLSKDGKTPLFFAKGGEFLGLIAVADKEKAEAAEVISRLKSANITPYLLTGDNRTVALAVARRVGIDEKNVFAEVLPDGKANVISELKKDKLVAMVGDGINDAPSLSAADVGITLENGSFVAADAAEVMILGSLRNLIEAISLSKKVVRNVKENLFWAFFYNVVCIPIAAGAFYYPFGWSLNPMIAAAAMSFSSVFVVSNALRLNLAGKEKPCDGACPVNVGKADAGENKDNNEFKEKEKMSKYEKTFKVSGMMCAHCEARVKAAVEIIDGVTDCRPDRIKGVAVVVSERTLSDDEVVAAIENEGYKVG